MHSVFCGIEGVDLEQKQNLKPFLLLNKLKWIYSLEVRNPGGRSKQG